MKSSLSRAVTAARRGGRKRSHRLAAAVVATGIATLSFSVAALAATPAATDLPTQSSAYNAPWQPAPAGYVAPQNDGLGVRRYAVHHVWVIVLENHAYDSSFTPLEGTENSYLEDLPSQGALLTNYYGTGHSSLDNYLSMVSGQAPLSDTQDDCPSYNMMSGGIDSSGTPSTNSDYGQFKSAAGADAPPNDNGCVYPDSVSTIFNQLNQEHKSWKVYAQDLADTPATGQNAGVADCGAPESTVGNAPTTGTGANYELNVGSANANSQYVAKHNPLPWFQSLLPASMGGQNQGDCSKNLAPLFPTYTGNTTSTPDAFYNDLQKASTTPALSFIVPNNCNNGHDAVCAGNNLSGEAAGFPKYNTSDPIPAAANDTGGTYAESVFLSVVIPEIEASAAFNQGGMIVVTYDEAYPPFTYSNDSQANSQLQNPDAAGSLTNDAAGETLYKRSLNWEPTGPNATVVYSSTGQALSAGPGDSAYLDRPTTADGDLVGCNEPTLDSGTDNWVTFTAPTPTNGSCVPGFQANGYRPATKSITGAVAAGASTVTGSPAQGDGINDEIQGEQVTSWSGTAPTLMDNGSAYTGPVYVGDVSDTPTQATLGQTSSADAYAGSFTLVDAKGNPVTVGAPYSGTIKLANTDNSTDPFYDAFDATLGGGDTGAVVISPYVKPGTVSNTYYNHYSLLRTIEDMFGTTGGVDGKGHLGFAAQPGLAPFGTDVFTNETGWLGDIGSHHRGSA